MKMTIHRQLETKNPLYVATLDNGVTVQVYGNYALGDDGKTYYHVEKKIHTEILSPSVGAVTFRAQLKFKTQLNIFC